MIIEKFASQCVGKAVCQLFVSCLPGCLPGCIFGTIESQITDLTSFQENIIWDTIVFKGNTMGHYLKMNIFGTIESEIKISNVTISLAKKKSILFDPCPPVFPHQFSL